MKTYEKFIESKPGVCGGIPHLVSYTLNPEPCEAFHAHSAGGDPAGSWGKPRTPCPFPCIGMIRKA